jgi:AraC-like DNA-binding protein
VTAKAHADVIRFHALLAELAQPGPLPTWTELVGRSSYYDQAHFIRAFARFTGYAPREYLRHLGEAGRAAPAFVYPEGD